LGEYGKCQYEEWDNQECFHCDYLREALALFIGFS
jgi:hypothetical protein